MDQARTGNDGSFILEGEASDPLPFDDIDPYLKLYHSCNKPTAQVHLHILHAATHIHPTKFAAV
jgi:hypothetical protein